MINVPCRNHAQEEEELEQEDGEKEWTEHIVIDSYQPFDGDENWFQSSLCDHNGDSYFWPFDGDQNPFQLPLGG